MLGNRFLSKADYSSSSSLDAGQTTSKRQVQERHMMQASHVELLYRIRHTIQEVLSFSVNCPIVFSAIRPLQGDAHFVPAASICLHQAENDTYTVVCLPQELIAIMAQSYETDHNRLSAVNGMSSIRGSGHTEILPENSTGLSICLKQMAHAFQKDCHYILGAPVTVTLANVFNSKDRTAVLAFALVFDTMGVEGDNKTVDIRLSFYV